MPGPTATVTGIVREGADELELVVESGVMITSPVYVPEARPTGFTDTANVAGLVPLTMAVAGLAFMKLLIVEATCAVTATGVLLELSTVTTCGEGALALAGTQ